MAQLQLVNTEQLEQALNNAEKRKFRRVRLPLGVRFMTDDDQEHPGVISDISVNGALIKSDQEVKEGDRIIAYIDQLGRYETTVVRKAEGEFAVNFPVSKQRRTKLADALTALVNGVGKQINNHRTKRIKQSDSHTVVSLDNGKEALGSLP